MDFFAQQDLARRNTRTLVLFFLLAVAFIVVLVNVIVAAFLFFGEDYNLYVGSREGLRGFLSYFTWQRFGTLGLAVTATVALVVLFKWFSLSTGGKAVAESMGGTRILPQSRDRAERRCLNVVEEMALAANMPVPAVYVLDSERGINAFAAGITPADAVIGVTRGTIDHLRRHELQGVIAHEVSHILNGDMRLNIRLAAMLKGITFIGDVGHFLMRSSRNRASFSRGSNAGPMMPVFGIALWILGSLGGLLAGFIKAAISRQREYLADASAVQYTRDPDGIGDALKVIGGYIPGTLVHAARAIEMSHIFFGQIQHSLWQFFATHPPLRTRIQRVDPQWDGQFIKRKPRQYTPEPEKPGHGEVGVGRAAVVGAAIAASAAAESSEADADFGPDPDTLEAETAAREELPLAFVRYSHEPLGAQALVLALLIHDEDGLAREQLGKVSEANIPGLAELTNTLYPGVRDLGAPRRLPLLEMCLPALKAMSLQQYRVFKNTLLHLIQADQQTELHEWCLFQLVRHYLDPEFIQVRPSRPRFNKIDKVAYHLRVVLSVISYAGGGEPAARFRLGADELGQNELQILPPEQADVAAFSRAVHNLADCYPLLKPRILKAMVATAHYDNQLNASEREVIYSMAAVMDCPLPDLATL